MNRLSQNYPWRAYGFKLNISGFGQTFTFNILHYTSRMLFDLSIPFETPIENTYIYHETTEDHYNLVVAHNIIFVIWRK